ncbi:MAG: phosphopantetheine-binding protein, partial [Acidobacteriota bacterium]|nr:phosphopantetheine-binding protein [Acidobacteriota bacterium]
TLRRHTDVREAVVICRDEKRAGKRLLGYVVCDGELAGMDESMVEDNLRRHLNAELPEYMVPSAIVKLDNMPLTPSGKLNRSALPVPQRSKVGAETVFVAPGSGLEQQIADIWKEALDLDMVGADQNFFELGGHSLLMVKVQEKLQKALGRQVPMVKLFEYPTVRSLTRYLEADRPEIDEKEGAARGASRREVLKKRRRRRHVRRN